MNYQLTPTLGDKARDYYWDKARPAVANTWPKMTTARFAGMILLGAVILIPMAIIAEYRLAEIAAAVM